MCVNVGKVMTTVQMAETQRFLQQQASTLSSQLNKLRETNYQSVKSAREDWAEQDSPGRSSAADTTGTKEKSSGQEAQGTLKRREERTCRFTCSRTRAGRGRFGITEANATPARRKAGSKTVKH